MPTLICQTDSITCSYVYVMNLKDHSILMYIVMYIGLLRMPDSY